MTSTVAGFSQYWAKDVLSSTLIVMAVNDALITISLCYYLQKTQKSALANGRVF